MWSESLAAWNEFSRLNFFWPSCCAWLFLSAEKWFYDIAPIKNFGVSSWYFLTVFLNKNFSVNEKSLTESCVGVLSLTRGLVLVVSYWAIEMLHLCSFLTEFVVKSGAVSNG
jgi:hypothetical protein